LCPPFGSALGGPYSGKALPIGLYPTAFGAGGGGGGGEGAGGRGFGGAVVEREKMKKIIK